MELKLRDYQQECHNLIETLEPGSYLIQMATGLGKTATFATLKSDLTEILYPYINGLTGRKPIILPIILDIKR